MRTLATTNCTSALEIQRAPVNNQNKQATTVDKKKKKVI